MPVLIPDEALEEAGIDPGTALIEFACCLFDAGKLDLWPAARLAGLSRVEFEAQLLERGLPIHRPTLEDFRQDLETLKYLDSLK